MPTRKRKTGIADKVEVEYDSLGSALWLTVGILPRKAG